MDSSGEKQWSKRVPWAKCREPYKTTLETLSSHWIEGALSNGELAIELWKMQSLISSISPWKERPDTMPARDMSQFDMSQELKQMQILVEAVLVEAEVPSTTAAERKLVFDNALILFGEPDQRSR